jgi:hypothetical protein
MDEQHDFSTLFSPLKSIFIERANAKNRIIINENMNAENILNLALIKKL